MSFQVFAASDDTPVVLASDELVKYGRGCFARTGSSAEADIILHSENSDRFQDSFKLESREGKLFISGSNPRSVLYGVYSYLKHFGFAFPYPGEEGEVIPENPQFSVDGFHIAETASYPFRGLAFSPACLPEDSAESRDIAMRHAFDLLSWMAKNQYNLFFKEGFDEERPGDQYSVVNGEHPLQHVEYALQGRSWEERRAVALWQKRVVEEARRYGFLIERGGHGWNYGVPEHYALLMNDLRRIVGGKSLIAPVIMHWFRITPENLAELVDLIEQKTINGKIAKEVFPEMFETGKKASEIVKEKGLVQVSDSGAIAEVVSQAIAANPAQVEQYRSGNAKVLQFLVGQVMKLSKGKANPQLVVAELKKQLG